MNGQDASFIVNLQVKKSSTTAKSDWKTFAKTPDVKKVARFPTARVKLLSTAPPQGTGEIAVLIGDTLIRLYATAPNGVTFAQLDHAGTERKSMNRPAR